MENVVCPHCGKTIELTEAIIHQLSDRVRKEEKEKSKAQLENAIAKERIMAEKRAREEMGKEFEKAEKEKLELEKKLEKQEKEKEEFLKKASDEAQKKADEEFRLKIKEKDKQLEDARRANDELNRKLNQRSQQLQGDVLEIDLKEKLKEAFQYDSVLDVPTGIRGGDIIQEVKNKFGNKAGTILWETKRQKAWNKEWLSKLKDDMRKIEANDCILVSDILPPNIKVYDRVENVWVTSYQYAIKLATVLRLGLINLAVVKSGASHGDEELRKFYAIVTSEKFRHLFEKRQEIISMLKKELDADKASTERRWRRQALYIDQLASNNRDLYGMLEDHIPSLKPLSEAELPILESGIENEQETLI